MVCVIKFSADIFLLITLKPSNKNWKWTVFTGLYAQHSSLLPSPVVLAQICNMSQHFFFVLLKAEIFHRIVTQHALLMC
jgi:hypothetical protein